MAKNNLRLCSNHARSIGMHTCCICHKCFCKNCMEVMQQKKYCIDCYYTEVEKLEL